MFDGGKIIGITDKVTPGMEWVLDGDGVATVKLDGSCCAIIDGKFYKRYDAKRGKRPPENAIPCCDPDPVTGHWPHWIPVDENDNADKWFVEAYNNALACYRLRNGTYEAIGPHFQGNPYKKQSDILIPHGGTYLLVDRTFEGIRDFLKVHNIEGIVFWKDGEPQCKIKRSDYGFAWPCD